MKKLLNSPLAAVFAALVIVSTTAFASPVNAKPESGTPVRITRQLLQKIDKDLANLIVLAMCTGSECGGIKDDECPTDNGCILTMPILLTRISARTTQVLERLDHKAASGIAFHHLAKAEAIHNLTQRISSDMKKFTTLRTCEDSNCHIKDNDECNGGDGCLINKKELVKRIASRQAELHSLLAQ